MDLDACHLGPDLAEVNRRHRGQQSRDVPTLDRLLVVLGELLDSEHASVSFWANALALREAVMESPDDWRAFLRMSA